jgi:membrane associated rhomboid family serine protease
VQVARHRKLTQAREAALALAAKEIPYWIERAGNDWEILVEVDVAKFAQGELDSIAAEESIRPKPVPVIYDRVRSLPLFLAAWMLGGFFLVQQAFGERWTEQGAAISTKIVQGEWWRTVTALTLHGDVPHLGANLVIGLLFAIFLQPLLGTGLTWILIILAGVLGNFANAFAYSGGQHASIGASTAVFGALGILVGIEVVSRWREPHTRNRWSLIVPVGAGLALLAFLGVGDQGSRVDVMAHLWGLLCGFPLGAVAAAMHLKQRLSQRVQICLGLLALALPVIAWRVAGAM